MYTWSQRESPPDQNLNRGIAQDLEIEVSRAGTRLQSQRRPFKFKKFHSKIQHKYGVPEEPNVTSYLLIQ